MHLRSGRLLPSNQDSTDQGLEDEDKDATVAKKNSKKMQASFFFVVAQFIQPVYPEFYFMLLYVEINQNPHIMTFFFTKKTAEKRRHYFPGISFVAFIPYPVTKIIPR